jgi:hypothetical protein
MPSFSRVGALAAVAACALAAVGAHAADEPPCPTISLEGIEQLAAPCADASNACSMKTGCIGAIQGASSSSPPPPRSSSPPPPPSSSSSRRRPN